jgi:hypothetical protein
MSRIPADLDQLMWTLAEKPDSSAIEDFERRYPEYRYELGRRLAAVRGLRGLKTSPASQSVPAFRPRERTPVSQPRWVVLGAGALALAAFGFATYTGITLVGQQSRSIQAKTDVPPVVQAEAPKRRVTEVPAPPPPVAAPNPAPAPAPAPQPAFRRPQNLEMQGAPLVTALEMIAAQAGLKLVTAPGMPNPAVNLAYQGWTPIEMLKDLGRQYAFTAFDQGDGTILVVPAIDPTVADSSPGRLPNPTELPDGADIQQKSNRESAELR